MHQKRYLLHMKIVLKIMKQHQKNLLKIVLRIAKKYQRKMQLTSMKDLNRGWFLRRSRNIVKMRLIQRKEFHIITRGFRKGGGG